MKLNNKHTAQMSDKALEMIMRDVLLSLQDLSLRSAYQGHEFGMEILAVEPVATTCKPQPDRAIKRNTNNLAEIINFPKVREAGR